MARALSKGCSPRSADEDTAHCPRDQGFFVQLVPEPGQGLHPLPPLLPRDLIVLILLRSKNGVSGSGVPCPSCFFRPPSCSVARSTHGSVNTSQLPLCSFPQGRAVARPLPPPRPTGESPFLGRRMRPVHHRLESPPSLRANYMVPSSWKETCEITFLYGTVKALCFKMERRPPCPVEGGFSGLSGKHQGPVISPSRGKVVGLPG